MFRNLFAPFEVLTYTREDGNKAVYKVFRPSKNVLTNKGNVVGFKAWKLANTGVNADKGWRAFRFDRIAKRDLTFV